MWTGVRSAIPSHLKTQCSYENELEPLEFFCGEKKFNPLISKSKQFYYLLVSVKVKPSRGFIKLKEDFDLDDSTAANVFRNIKSLSYETFIRSFQSQLLADIIFTNYRLAKIGYVPNDLCAFCEKGSETVHHLLNECSFAHRFWKHLENFWFVLSGKYVEFTLKYVFVGRQVGESDQLLNYLFIVLLNFIFGIVVNVRYRQIWKFLRQCWM